MSYWRGSFLRLLARYVPTLGDQSCLVILIEPFFSFILCSSRCGNPSGTYWKYYVVRASKTDLGLLLNVRPTMSTFSRCEIFRTRSIKVYSLHFDSVNRMVRSVLACRAILNIRASYEERLNGGCTTADRVSSFSDVRFQERRSTSDSMPDGHHTSQDVWTDKQLLDVTFHLEAVSPLLAWFHHVRSVNVPWEGACAYQDECPKPRPRRM